MHRLKRPIRLLLSIAALLAVVPVLLGSIVFGLAVYVGALYAFSAGTVSSAWVQVLGVFSIHLVLSAFVAVSAIMTMMGRNIPRTIIVGLIASLVVTMLVCALDYDSASHHSFIAGYTWPAMGSAALLLAWSALCSSTNTLAD